MSRDTSKEAEAVQTRLFREAGTERRFQMMLQMTHAAFARQKEALQIRHPGASEREIGLMQVAVNYGDDLASRVRAYLENLARR